MKLIVEIEMDNAAFDPEEGGRGFETGRILKNLGKDIEGGMLHLDDAGDETGLRDINGNRVGVAKVVEE